MRIVKETRNASQENLENVLDRVSLVGCLLLWSGAVSSRVDQHGTLWGGDSMPVLVSGHASSDLFRH